MTIYTFIGLLSAAMMFLGAVAVFVGKPEVGQYCVLFAIWCLLVLGIIQEE